MAEVCVVGRRVKVYIGGVGGGSAWLVSVNNV